MMFDAFDVLLLDLRVEAEQGEKAGQRFVAALNFIGDRAAFVGEDEAAIFDVVDVTEIAEFLDHAGDTGLTDVERRSDIDHARVTLLLDKLLDAFEIILRALAGLG